MQYIDEVRAVCAMLGDRYPAQETEAIATRLVMHMYGVDFARLLDQVAPLSAVRQRRVKDAIAALQKGVPLQYALGVAEFMGHRFKVGPGVLIPRPETEELTEYIATYATQFSAGGMGAMRVLDIGTGSGCIALSLALRGAAAVGVDISSQALGYARYNRRALGARARFFQRDLLQNATTNTMPMPRVSGGYTVVVSNPPYVPIDEVLSPHVADHEPKEALYVHDWKPWYRAIAQHAKRVLAPTGRLYVETHQKATTEVQALFIAEGFQHAQIKQDFFGHDRFVHAW